MAIELPQLSRLNPGSQEEVYSRLLGKERSKGKSDFWEQYNKKIKEVAVKNVPLKSSMYETLMGVFEKHPQLAKSKAKLRHFVAATLLKIFKTGYDGDLFHKGEKISAISNGLMTLKLKGASGEMVDVKFDLTKAVDSINSREYVRKYQSVLGKSRRSLMALKVDIGRSVNERLAILKSTNTLHSAMQFLRLKADFDGRADLYFHLQDKGYLRNLGKEYHDGYGQNSQMHAVLIKLYEGKMSRASGGRRTRSSSNDRSDSRTDRQSDVDKADMNDPEPPVTTLASAPDGPRIAGLAGKMAEALIQEFPEMQLEYVKRNKSYRISLESWPKGMKVNVKPTDKGKWSIDGVAGKFSFNEAVLFGYSTLKALNMARLQFFYKQEHPFKLKGNQFYFEDGPENGQLIFQIPKRVQKHGGAMLGHVNSLAARLHQAWKIYDKAQRDKWRSSNSGTTTKPPVVAPTSPPMIPPSTPPAPPPKPDKTPQRRTPTTPRKLPELKEKPEVMAKLLMKWNRAMENFIYDVSANDPKAIEGFKKFADFQSRAVNSMKDLELHGKATDTMKASFKAFKIKCQKMKATISRTKINRSKLLELRKWLLESQISGYLNRGSFELSADRRTVLVKGERGKLKIWRVAGKGWQSMSFPQVMTDIGKMALINYHTLRGWEDHSHQHKGRMHGGNRRPFYYDQGNIFSSKGISLMKISRMGLNAGHTTVLKRKYYPKGRKGELMFEQTLKSFNDAYESREKLRLAVETADKQTTDIVNAIKEATHYSANNPTKLSAILKAKMIDLKTLRSNLQIFRGQAKGMMSYGTNVERIEKLIKAGMKRINGIYQRMKQLGFDREGTSISQQALDSFGKRTLKDEIGRLGVKPRNYEIISVNRLKIKVAGMPSIFLKRAGGNEWGIEGVFDGTDKEGKYRGYVKQIGLKETMFMTITMLKNLKKNWNSTIESGYGLQRGKKHPIYLDGDVIRLATAWTWSNPEILNFDKAPLIGANYNSMKGVLIKNLLTWLRKEYRRHKTAATKAPAAPVKSGPPVRRAPDGRKGRLLGTPTRGRSVPRSKPKSNITAAPVETALQKLESKLKVNDNCKSFTDADNENWKGNTAASLGWLASVIRGKINSAVEEKMPRYQSVIRSFGFDQSTVKTAIYNHVLEHYQKNGKNSTLTKTYAGEQLSQKFMLLDQKMKEVAGKLKITPSKALDLYSKYIGWNNIRSQTKLEELMGMKLSSIQGSLQSFRELADKK